MADKSRSEPELNRYFSRQFMEEYNYSTQRYAPRRWSSITSYPARPRRIIVKYSFVLHDGVALFR